MGESGSSDPGTSAERLATDRPHDQEGGRIPDHEPELYPDQAFVISD